MGLQVPRGFHSEATEAADLRCVAWAPWGVVPRVGQAQGVEDRGGASDGRSRSHVLEHPAEIRGVERGRVHQGQKRDPDCAPVWGPTTEFHGLALLGPRLLCLHGRTGRADSARVHPKSRKGGRALRPNEARHGVSRQRRLTNSWAPLRR